MGLCNMALVFHSFFEEETLSEPEKNLQCISICMLFFICGAGIYLIVSGTLVSLPLLYDKLLEGRDLLYLPNTRV